MNPTAESPPPPVPLPMPDALWRKVWWVVLATAVTAPLMALAGLLLVGMGESFHWPWPAVHPGLTRLIVTVTAIALAVRVARGGLKRGWHRRSALLIGITSVLAFAVFVAFEFHAFRLEQRERSIWWGLREMDGAAEQFFRENPDRLFARYDELVGPDRYIKHMTSFIGEDYHPSFPVRRDRTLFGGWIVSLPDGRIVFSSSTVKEPKADGVDIFQLPDGSRFETTYHGGVPDGLFRAFYPGGRPWGEANYVKGRITGPAWLYTLDGHKVDELADGDAAQAAIAANEAAAAAAPTRLGRQKLAAGDLAGAIADFNRALELDPSHPDLYLHARADAKKALGDLDGAIEDYTRVRGITRGNLFDVSIQDQLESAYLERSRNLQAKNDRAGADADLSLVLSSWLGPGRKKFAQHDFAGAIANCSHVLELDPALALHPAAVEVYLLRAKARFERRELAGAIADLTRVIATTAGQPQKADLRLQRGSLRWLQNDLPGAEEDFRAAAGTLAETDNHPNRFDASCWLYLTLRKQGRPDEATQALAPMPSSAAETARGSLNRTLANFLLGRITENELLARQPASKPSLEGEYRFQARFLSAMQHQVAGDEPGALDRFRQALVFREGDHLAVEHDAARWIAAQGYAALAREKFRQRNYYGAISDLNGALLADPARGDLYGERADAKLACGDFTNAIADHEQARQESPGEDAAPFRLAIEESLATLHRIGGTESAAALGDLIASFKYRPPVWAVHEFRGDARAARGDLAGAGADYDISLRRVPGHVGILYKRGHVRRQQHDLPGASEDFRAVVAPGMNWLACDAAFWLFFSEQEQGRGAGAASELDRIFTRLARSIPPNNPALPAFLDWNQQVADLLLGRISAKQLLAKADASPPDEKNGHRFTTLFFLALLRRQAGDGPGALDYFRQALAVPPYRIPQIGTR